MKVLIIGAGNGGLAFGAKLAERGVKIVLYDKYQEMILPIMKNNNRITLIEGKKQKEISFYLVTNKLKKAIEDVKIIFVITPAFAHRSIANELVKYVTDEHIVMLHPGRTGGALEVKNIFERHNISPVIAEAETLLFACRKVDNKKIQIHGIKNRVGIAVIPTVKSNKVINLLNLHLPYFQTRNSVFDTSLRNIGSIFHPIPFLLNVTRVESKERFKFYHEGITPYVANLLEELDKERIAIAAGYNLNIPSALEWLNQNYALNGSTLYESIQMNEIYKNIYTPLDVFSRYVLEDVPMSLVPMSHMAKKVNINTPIIDSVIHWASAMYGENFFQNGRTFVKMGLNKNLVT